MQVRVTCNNENDQSKTKGARVAIITLWDFPDAQEQLTLQSLVGSDRNSNPSEIL